MLSAVNVVVFSAAATRSGAEAVPVVNGKLFGRPGAF